MTNDVSKSQAEAQEHPDAWAYAALKEKPPEETDTDKTSANPPPKDGIGTDNGTAGTGGESKSQASQGDQSDPLEGYDLSKLLEHPVLGPQLNSWNDKSANSRLQSERDKILNELEPQVRQRLEDEAVGKYLDDMSDEERGQELARNPQLASKWAQIQQSREQANSHPEEVARAAEVYALATQISSVDQLIDASDLPDAEKESLKDVSKFQGQGAGAIVGWTQQVMQRLVEHAKEKGIEAEIDTRWNSYLEDNQARSPRARPGMTPPGSRAEPAPDVIKGDSREFLSAFQ